MLFAGLLYGREEHCQRALEELRDSFGPISVATPPSPWAHSEYYEEELGGPVTRRFVFFERIIEQDELAALKRRAMRMEEALSLDGRRSVNIDPGYLTLAKVVLATTKDYSHRIYLGDGIFAEATLIYKDGSFQPHVFTYRDYREPRNVETFNRMRETFRRKLEEEGGELNA